MLGRRIDMELPLIDSSGATFFGRLDDAPDMGADIAEAA